MHIRGRGTDKQPKGRFQDTETVRDPGPAPRRVDTQFLIEKSRSIITKNRSPDVPFEQSINPYRGCEHGCVYCYARPAHAYMDLSPGLDFETRIFCKPDAPRLLEEALTRPGYRVSTIALGTNTDPYQPAERDRRITRQILEVLADFSHPASIVTKSSLVERDADILEGMARKNLVRVTISVTSLDKALKRRLEPRTAGPARRLETIRTLTARGIPTGSLVAPVIPGLNDHEIENIVAAVAAAGADCAGYILLRLPWEVQPLFEDWLEAHYPMKASKVMNLVRSCRDGQAYDARFGHRMRGNGEYAGLIRRRFSKALRRSGLKYGESSALDTRRFSVPPRAGDQLALTL